MSEQDELISRLATNAPKYGDELLLDKEHAKLKGFDNVFDWYLACLNAEVNILLDPKLRTADRLDKLASQAKIYIEKLAKAKQHYEQRVGEYFEDGRRILMDFHQGEITRDEALERILNLKPHPEQKRLDRPELREIENILEGIGFNWALSHRHKVAKEILALILDIEKLGSTYKRIEEAKKQEDNRIADWLLKQGAVWVDKNYAIIEAIRKGQALKGGKNNDTKDSS